MWTLNKFQNVLHSTIKQTETSRGGLSFIISQKMLNTFCNVDLYFCVAYLTFGSANSGNYLKPLTVKVHQLTKLREIIIS